MLIGELSKRSGVSRDTIRFYEKEGLISVVRKETRDNNNKEYSESTLERLLYLKRLKGYGFTLNEASDLLELIALDEATCDNWSNRVEEKVKVVEEKIKELVSIRLMLVNTLHARRDSTCCSPKTLGNCPLI